MKLINQRIALIIDRSGITKTEFAKRLKVSQPYISKLTKTGTPSERLIDSISKEFNVNEEWLRTGAGGEENMFVQDDTPKLKDLIIKMLTDLPDKYWDQIEVELKNGIKKEE